MPKFILASSSPRRKELLANIGYFPDQIVSPNIEEYLTKKELPTAAVKRLAEEKAVKVAKDYPKDILRLPKRYRTSFRHYRGKRQDDTWKTKKCSGSKNIF